DYYCTLHMGGGIWVF
nr:immunoglobulin light chain junction region [Macaca mulatta]